MYPEARKEAGWPFDCTESDKAQGGKFELYLDGDLFKVLIRFPVPKETEDVYQEVEQ